MNRNRNKYICVGMSKLAYILANMPLTNKGNKVLKKWLISELRKGT